MSLAPRRLRLGRWMMISWWRKRFGWRRRPRCGFVLAGGAFWIADRVLQGYLVLAVVVNIQGYPKKSAEYEPLLECLECSSIHLGANGVWHIPWREANKNIHCTLMIRKASLPTWACLALARVWQEWTCKMIESSQITTPHTPSPFRLLSQERKIRSGVDIRMQEAWYTIQRSTTPEETSVLHYVLSWYWLGNALIRTKIQTS